MSFDPSTMAGVQAFWNYTEGSGVNAFSGLGSGSTINLLETTGQRMSEKWWSAANGTVTEFASGRATRFNVALSAAGLMYRQLALAAGTYTFSVEVKSNTALPQTIKIGIENNRPEIIATTSWQRFSVTETVAAGTRTIWGFLFSDLLPASDVLLRDAQLQTGASFTSYIAPNWTMVTDGASWASAPARLSFQDDTEQGGYAEPPGDPISFSEATLYAVVKGTNAVAPLPGYGAIIGEDWGTTRLNLSSGRGDAVLRFDFNGSTVNAVGSDIHDGMWHVVTGVYDGSTLKIYMDGIWRGTTTASPAAVDIRYLIAGAFNLNGYGPDADIAFAAICNEGHDAAAIATYTAGIGQLMLTKSLVVDDPAVLLNVEGDSIGAFNALSPGMFNAWHYKARHQLDNVVHGQCFAVGGSIVTDGSDTPGVSNTLQARAAQVDAAYVAGKLNLLLILIGANDLALVSAATFVANLKSYCLSRKAVGHKVIVCTLLPQGAVHTNFVARRDDAIAGIELNDGGWWDYLIPFSADPVMGPAAAADDTGLYADAVHPTLTTGHNNLANIAEPVLAEAIADSAEPTSTPGYVGGGYGGYIITGG